MEWIVSLNCIVLKNILSQEFHYIKCQAFNPSSSSNNAILSLEKEKWNSGGETRIFHLNTITEHFAKCCEKQSGITLETWLGEKQTWFLMSGYFILTFSLLKSFSCPLPSRVLYRCQSGLELFWWGLKMNTVIPEKMAVTPRSHVTDAETGGFIFLALASN